MRNDGVIDVKIEKKINCANHKTWFELFEMESGEVLFSGSQIECEGFYKTLDQYDYELING